MAKKKGMVIPLKPLSKEQVLSFKALRESTQTVPDNEDLLGGKSKIHSNSKKKARKTVSDS